jgi:hypothetical protein
MAARHSAYTGFFSLDFAFATRRTLSFLALLFFVATMPIAAMAASTSVVISQLYLNGGSTNAAYTNKYVELFNLGNAPVTLNGWSLAYSSATGTTWPTANKYTIPATPAITLQPGQYFLVQLTSNGSGGVALPTPDASTTALNPSGTAGKIALLGPSTTLSATNACPTPTSGTVVDFIGYGSTANCSEGGTTSTTVAPVPSLTTADFRAGGGCTDTDNNATNFATGPAAPRNSASALAPCGGSSNPVVASKSANPGSLVAGDSALLQVTVTPGANPASSGLTVTVDLSSIGGGASVPLYDDGAHGDGASGDNVFADTTTVGNSVAPGSYSLPITVTDAQSRTAAAASISLTVTLPPEPHTIMEIQGHGARSAFAGAGTATGSTLLKTPANGHTNIVTALKSNGFFMQDAQGDGDITTSDAIFVYTGAAPTVASGDSVSVVGYIQEFSGSSEIVNATVSVLSSGNALPAAYDLSTTLPSTDPGTGICTGPGSTIVVPSNDGLTRNDGYQAANFACLDGMLVTMNHGIVNAPTYTTANSGITPSPTSPNNGFYAVAGGPRSLRKAGILGSDTNRTTSIPTFWGNPELIQVYYPGLGVAASSFPQAPNMPAGGIYDGGQEIQLTGVMQGFQSATMPDPTYEIYPRSGSDIVLLASPTYPIAVPDPIAGKLRIGTQNMLHFFDSSFDGVDTSAYTDRCQASASDVANNVSGLNTPLAPGADDTCPTSTQYQTRLAKMSLQIRTILKAPVVQVVQEAENLGAMHDIAAQIQSDDASIVYQSYLLKGNDPGGINIGIFVRSGVTVNSVTQLYLNTSTTACSGGGTCLLNDRPPVLLDATYQGYHFRVLAIYDRSLSSLGAAGKDYVGQKRRAQAEQVACILQALQTTGASVDCDAGAPGAAAGNAQQDASGTVTTGSFAVSGDATVPVIVLGDFNAYEFSDGYVDVTGTIMGTVDGVASHSVYPPTANYVRPNPVLFDTGSSVAQDQHYSYNFGGYLQEIDHILMTSVGQGDFISVDSGRGNSDSSVVSLTLTQSNTARRTSDHDGQVVTLGWVVTPSAGNYGTISPSTMQTVSSAKSVVFTVTPNLGSNVASVTDNCGSGGIAAGSLNGTTNIYTIPAGVNHDCQVSATFTTPELELSVTPLPSTVAQYSEQQLVYTLKVNNANASYQVPSFNTSVANATIESIVAVSSAPTQFTCISSADHATCMTVNFASIGPPYGDLKFIVTLHADGPIGSTINAGGRFETYAGLGPASETSTSTTIVGGLVNGTCGQASNSAFTSLASDNPTLCGSGKVVNFTGSGPWQWTCSGVSGGTDSSACSASKAYTVTTTASQHGSITPQSQTVASGSTASFSVASEVGYSANVTGDTCTVTHGSGSTWTTNAITADCAVTATFALDPVNGTCGTANGGTFTSLASNDASLCSTGTLANFTGSGPWTWTCNGTNGGSASPTCSANIKTWSVATTGSGVGGTISAPAAATVNNGSATTFTVTANSDYAIDTVTGNTCTPAVQSGSTYTTGPITADCTITATFVRVAGYVPLNPSRILDTRSIGVTSDGQFAKGGAVTGGHSIDLTVLGRGGIPASGVKAVVLNVTATGTTANSYVTVWPSGGNVPHASNLNIFPGQNNTNLVIVEVGTGGNVSLFNALGATDLIADVQGYFSDASDMTALVPARFLDTRSIGVTVDGLFQKGGALSGQTQLDLGVNGRAGIPSTGVGSVILNVTATGTTAPGYVTVWPTGGPTPHTSNLNFVAAQTIPNLVISKVSNDGKVSLFNSAGNTDLIADAMGWFPANSELTSIDPARVLDTRADIGVTVDGQFAGEGPVTPGGTLDLIVTGRGGVPLSGVSAVVLNVTVTGPTASGYLTAWPTGSTRPFASNLNFVAYQTVPNLVIVKVGNSGAVSLFNSAGHSDVVVDVVGWFASP